MSAKAFCLAAWLVIAVGAANLVESRRALLELAQSEFGPIVICLYWRH